MISFCVKFISGWRAATALLLAAIVSGGAHAQGTVSLKLGLLAVNGHPVYEAAVRYAELVSERTGGTVKIEIFPGGQLGDEAAMRDLVVNGALDMASIADPVAAGLLKKFELFSLPYLWRDRAHLEKVASGPIGEELAQEYENKVGVKILALNWQQGTRHLVSKREATRIDDVKGLKIRLPQIQMWQDAWTAFGAIPTAIPFTETYLALQQGTVDAVEIPFDWIYTYKFHEAAKNISLTGHITYSNQLHMNAKAFDRLTPEQQKVLKETAVEVGRWETDLVVNGEANFRSKLEKEGAKISEVDTAPYRELAADIQEKYANLLGRELFDRIIETR